MIVAPAAIRTLRSIAMGLPIVTAPRRLDGMPRGDAAHVRPDHHIVRDVEAAEVIVKCSSG